MPNMRRRGLAYNKRTELDDSEAGIACGDGNRTPTSLRAPQQGDRDSFGVQLRQLEISVSQLAIRRVVTIDNERAQGWIFSTTDVASWRYFIMRIRNTAPTQNTVNCVFVYMWMLKQITHDGKNKTTPFIIFIQLLHNTNIP
jgi:hypothetical protein